jgi:folate-binding Fe-S cluster repair protein YgfZ
MPSTTLPKHGFCHMPRQTIIQICGADRVPFLHNFCTNDIKQLANHDWCELFITTVQGRCLGYGTVTALEDSLVLATAPNQSATIIEHFSKYIITEDVSLVNKTAVISFLTVIGLRLMRFGYLVTRNNRRKFRGVNHFQLIKQMHCELKTEFLFMD